MSDAQVFAVVTGLQVALFLWFTAWRANRHQEQVDCLTSKIMAKNYVEFSTYRGEEVRAPEPKPEKEPKKVVTDPVLGRNF